MATRLKRINKRAAIKAWSSGETIYLLPAKIGLYNMYFQPLPVKLSDHQDHAELYAPGNFLEGSELWKGTIEQTAWDLMYNNWAYYNTCYELGYYAHYYVAA